jgi:hypothetical protein
MLAAEMDNWLAELNASAQRQAEAQAQEIQERVRTYWSYLNEEKRARVIELLTRNPRLTDFQVVMALSTPRK